MNQIPKVVSFDRSPAYAHHRAMVNRRENNPIDALELMRRAAEFSPENREYQLDLAEMYCEMGCHDQSNRLLLDMLAQNGAPAECFYGLALNQLGQNDLEGARHSLQLYCENDPDGARSEDARRLATELDIYGALNRPVQRKVYRATKIGERACDAMREDDFQTAKRLFERSLEKASEQYDIRALYAMTLMLMGYFEEALENARRAAEGFPPSDKALCVAAQVFYALREEDQARALVEKVIEERPNGNTLRMLLHTLGEMKMHEEVAECARLALQETPYDRELLHIRAVAMHKTGKSDGRVGRYWLRILRLDPEDTVAAYYRDAAEQGKLDDDDLPYEYRVPDIEFKRRVKAMASHTGGGIGMAREAWRDDAEFRKLVRWAATCGDSQLSLVAMTLLSSMNDAESDSLLRSLLFGKSVQPAEKLHAATMLKAQEIDWKKFLPAGEMVDVLFPDEDQLLNPLPMGDRQLLRYAADEAEYTYGVSALPALTMLWTTYRMQRGVKNDPLVNADAATAALVYVFLNKIGKKQKFTAMAAHFGCSARKMDYYARRISAVLERYEGENGNEDL